ncbi:hypothetical protein M378DRAFT_453218 [Amanita muscaria Koide BX008]|uniref:Uncharacterized protein n=1 Tax=Amanita muscaria (strain Koide BX008) TaxID=946122 RepID=A0A0C2S275_AMAMK|nr:hypothetical protein M378DRAFT_453218 [Amanita muscaria Koide BX008]
MAISRVLLCHGPAGASDNGPSRTGNGVLGFTRSIYSPMLIYGPDSVMCTFPSLRIVAIVQFIATNHTDTRQPRHYDVWIRVINAYNTTFPHFSTFDRRQRCCMDQEKSSTVVPKRACAVRRYIPLRCS